METNSNLAGVLVTVLFPSIYHLQIVFSFFTSCKSGARVNTNFITHLPVFELWPGIFTSATILEKSMGRK